MNKKAITIRNHIKYSTQLYRLRLFWTYFKKNHSSDCHENETCKTNTSLYQASPFFKKPTLNFNLHTRYSDHTARSTAKILVIYDGQENRLVSRTFTLWERNFGQGLVKKLILENKSRRNYTTAADAADAGAGVADRPRPAIQSTLVCTMGTKVYMKLYSNLYSRKKINFIGPK